MTSVERVEPSQILPESLVIPEDLRTNKEPPEPSLKTVFKNGTGKKIGMELSLANLEEFPPLQRLIEEKEKFEKIKERIPEALQAISRKKRSHGGGTISPKKRRKWQEDLKAEQKALPDKIEDRTRRIDQLTTQLKAFLAKSHPFSPLTVEVDGEAKVIKGESLTEAEQVWWQYVRKKGQEGPWQFIQRGEDQRFSDLQEYFVAKLEAQLAPSKKKEGAKARLKAITNRLGEMKDGDFAPLQPHIQEATDYVSTFFRQR